MRCCPICGNTVIITVFKTFFGKTFLRYACARKDRHPDGFRAEWE